MTTWNDWWETNLIEPIHAFGEPYFDITRDHAVRWKGD